MHFYDSEILAGEITDMIQSLVSELISLTLLSFHAQGRQRTP